MNKLLTAIQEQSKPLQIFVFIATLITGLFIWLIPQEAVSVRVLVRDTVAEANVPIYVGMISNIGIYFWIATATVSLFTALIGWQQTWQKRHIYFYLCGGLLILYMGIDDAFLLHESVLPAYLNVSETVIYASYGVVILIYGLSFLRTILKTPYLLLVMVAGLMSLSLVADVFKYDIVQYYQTITQSHTVQAQEDTSESNPQQAEAVSNEGETISQTDSEPDTVTASDASENASSEQWKSNLIEAVEDGPKFLSIVTCFVYFLMTALQHLQLYHDEQVAQLKNVT